MSKAAPIATSVILKKGHAAPATGDTPVIAPTELGTASTHSISAKADLAQLAFKVPAIFNKEFRQAALDADLKLNELLFKAFEAYKKLLDKQR